MEQCHALVLPMARAQAFLLLCVTSPASLPMAPCAADPALFTWAWPLLGRRCELKTGAAGSGLGDLVGGTFPLS